MIGGFRSVLCVSVFQGSLLVVVVMIDGSKNVIAKAAFELQSLHVCEKRSKSFSFLLTTVSVKIVGTLLCLLVPSMFVYKVW